MTSLGAATGPPGLEGVDEGAGGRIKKVWTGVPLAVITEEVAVVTACRPTKRSGLAGKRARVTADAGETTAVVSAVVDVVGTFN